MNELYLCNSNIVIFRGILSCQIADVNASSKGTLLLGVGSCWLDVSTTAAYANAVHTIETKKVNLLSRALRRHCWLGLVVISTQRHDVSNCWLVPLDGGFSFVGECENMAQCKR